MKDFEHVDVLIAEGKLWRAKEILQGRLSAPGYNADLYHRFGKLLVLMGDLRLAGRFLFLSGVRQDDGSEALDLFRQRDMKGSFANFWSNMPAGARLAGRAEVPEIIITELLAAGFDQRDIARRFSANQKALEIKQGLAKAKKGSIRERIEGWLIVGVFVSLLAGFVISAIKGLISVFIYLKG